MKSLEKFARVLKLAAMVSIVLVIFAGCSKDEDDKKGTAEPISIEFTALLDSFFMYLDLSLIDPNPETGIIPFVINSKEELESVKTLKGFNIDCIDFSKYTLIGGVVCLDELHVVKGVKSLQETEDEYLITIDVVVWNTTPIFSNHFWKVYPKFKEGKSVRFQ